MSTRVKDVKALRLLSLDGGGIRGLSELLILREIMNRIKFQQKLESVPLPCTYFDIIGGTGTGGIIAIMLGRLRMSIDDAIERYGSLSAKIFTNRNDLGNGMFNASTLENVIKRIVKNYTGSEEELMIDGKDEACKTFVCAMAADNIRSPRLFRTYDVPENQSINCAIWEAARATSAMTKLFKEIEITENGIKERFIDGGVGYNNPIRVVLQEAEVAFPGRHVACVVSIGSGQTGPMGISKPTIFQRLRPLPDVIKILERIMTDCEKTAEEVQRQFKKLQNVYFRLNVEQGMQDIDIAQWESMYVVKTHTLHYLQGVKVNERVKSLVNAVCKQRGMIRVEQLNGIEPSLNISLQDKDLLLKMQSWLSAPDPSINLNKACETRHGNTGQWFIEGSEFKKWKHEAESFLWIHGIPGSGKTILSSTIINSIKDIREGDLSLGLGYFFFDFGNAATRSCRNLIHSLITQLSRCRTAAPAALVNMYERNGWGATKPAITELKPVLKELLENFEHSYIILDALDECNVQERDVVLAFLEELTSWKLGNLHVLVTSREEGNIKEWLKPLVSAEMNLASSVMEDIQMYLRDVLEDNKGRKGWTEKEKKLIESTLMRKADGMFLLVRRQLEEVANCRTPKELKSTLKSLPESLNETYERILDTKVLERDRGYVIKALQCLAFSFQSVMLAELVAVLEFDVDEGRVDDESKFWDPQDVMKMCPAMIHLDEKSGEVKLSHSSVKDFLVSTKPGAEWWRGNFDTVSGHMFMATTCLAYLLQFTDPTAIRRSVITNFPLALYAAKNWTRHVLSENIARRDTVQHLMRRLLRHGDTQYVNWVKLHDVDMPWRHVDHISDTIPSPLYYAALIGLEDALIWLVDEGADVSAQGGLCGSALQAASSKGHEEIVRLLVEKGANVNAEGGYYGNALQAASSTGHEEMVRLLVEKGANVNAEGREYGNALQAASWGGHEGIVRLLVKEGANVNAQGGEYGNALQAALWRGHEGIVRLLVEKGANVNAEGGEYGNALQAASWRGHEGIVRLLVEKGANVNAEGGKYGNALQAASLSGRVEIMRLLVENGADVNAEGGYYGNVLQAASSNGHEEIVRLLVEKGANVNAEGGKYGNALQAASSSGEEEIVRLLVEKGANVNAEGGLCGNALQAASSSGHEGIVRLLVEKGANVNAGGGKYGNSLVAASLRGHEKIVRLLVEKGANVNAEGGEYGNPLQAASSEGEEEIVRLLVEKGANVNAEGGKYGNALQAASLRGDEKIVQLLVGKGANVNAKGGKYGNALEAASWSGEEGIVRLLVENGAVYPEYYRMT